MGDEPTKSDEAVERATHALGEPEAEYRAHPARLRAKYILAAALIAGGLLIGLLWLTLLNAKGEHVVVHFILWPIAIGIGLLWHLWRHRGLRVLVYPEGLFVVDGHSATSFPWEEIKAIRLTPSPKDEPHFRRGENGEITGAWLPLNEPKLHVWNCWLELERADGAKAKLTGALAEMPELAATIQKATYTRLRAEADAKLAAGEGVALSKKMTLQPWGFADGKARVEWSTMKEITLIANLVFFKKKKSWRSGLAKAATSIDNLHVLLAIAEEKKLLNWIP